MQQTKRVDKLAVNWLFWMIKGPTKYAGKSSRVKFGLAPPTELKKENGAGFMETKCHYTDWGKKGNQKSQPNGGRKENCLGMFVSWGWVDRPWEASMPFLCQYSEMKACYVMK